MDLDRCRTEVVSPELALVLALGLRWLCAMGPFLWLCYKVPFRCSTT